MNVSRAPRLLRRTSTALAVAAALGGCAARSTSAGPAAEVEPEIPVRGVILYIGDGMGPQQLGLLDLWARRAPTGPVHIALHDLAAAATIGLSATDPAEQLVVDSACSATQLATGRSALSETIGLDATGTSALTILERAERAGLATGLVSDTRLTHATPAAFAAHVGHRAQESEIARQMIASGADVLLSGGLRFFVGPAPDDLPADLPFSSRSRRSDDLLGVARAAGFAVVHDRAELAAAAADGAEPILGLFADSGMMDGIAWSRTRDDAARTEPTLREMTEAALAQLSRDPDGFFLMVEAGQIDWACHDNDAGWLLHELQKFDDTLAALLAFVGDHPDTLLVVTADHETGGFGFSYSGHDIPPPRPAPGPGFAGDDYYPHNNFGQPEQIARLDAQGARLAELVADLPEDDPRAALAARVAERTPWALSGADLDALLASEPNRFPEPGEEAAPTAVIHDFRAFYPYLPECRQCVFGRVLAEQQNVVWSTGTHTHTPVAVFAVGPPRAAARFGGYLHHVEVGQLLLEALLGP